MLSNTDITLYNKYYSDKAGAYVYKRTYIQGVNWQGEKAISGNVRNKGIASGDKYNIYIPFSADTQGKKYLKPKTYSRLPEEELDKYYTFNNEDKIVRGTIDFEIGRTKKDNLAYLENYYDDVVNISGVDINDHGESLRHFKVRCE